MARRGGFPGGMRAPKLPAGKGPAKGLARMPKNKKRKK